MRFIFKRSLNYGARKALARGVGRYRKYAVDRDGDRWFIATLDDNGRAMDWVLVVNGHGKSIEAIEA